MLILIAQSFYFVLPAYLANMMPVFLAKLHLLEFLNIPIDGNRKIGGKELFGRHKTWRGLVAGVIGGLLVAFIQSRLHPYPLFNSLSIFDYSSYWLIFGFLAGFGALIGDLVKSFFKRRVGIKSGGIWPIFDQLDFILGFFFFTVWIVNPSLAILLTILIMTAILHPLSNLIGYLLGLKKVWW